MQNRDKTPCKVWAPHMITNTIYCWLLLRPVSSCCSSPLSMPMPQLSWFLNKSALPALQLEHSLMQRFTTLTTSLSWSSLSHIARANGPSKAWLFYEFRTPYLSMLTLQQVKMKKSPIYIMTYMTCKHRYCYSITFTTWLIWLNT